MAKSNQKSAAGINLSLNSTDLNKTMNEINAKAVLYKATAFCLGVTDAFKTEILDGLDDL